MHPSKPSGLHDEIMCTNMTSPCARSTPAVPRRHPCYQNIAQRLIGAGASHGQQGGDKCHGGQLQPHGYSDQASPRTCTTAGKTPNGPSLLA